VHESVPDAYAQRMQKDQCLRVRLQLFLIILKYLIQHTFKKNLYQHYMAKPKKIGLKITSAQIITFVKFGQDSVWSRAGIGTMITSTSSLQLDHLHTFLPFYFQHRY
jgi:hypothetical protein